MADVGDVRRYRGEIAYHAGLSAGDLIGADYERRGFSIAARRWRGKGGEIDLIAEDGAGLVFVEVKQSRNFDQAVEHVSPHQMKHLYASAEEYLGQMPNGSLTDVRFDVALVNGQREVRVIENAFGHG